MRNTIIFSAIWFPFPKKAVDLASQSLWTKEELRNLSYLPIIYFFSFLES